MSKQKTQKKHATPKKLVYLFMLLGLIVVLLGIWIGIEVAKSGVKGKVGPKFEAEDVKIISKNDFDDLKLNFYATKYSLGDSENDGSVTLSMTCTGGRDSSINVSEIKAKICLSAKWIDYVSDASTSDSIQLNKQWAPTIQIKEKFPKHASFPFVKIENPNAYLYLSWKEKIGTNEETKKIILEYEYDEYVISSTIVS
jgi:hypothetical protein